MKVPGLQRNDVSTCITPPINTKRHSPSLSGDSLRLPGTGENSLTFPKLDLGNQRVNEPPSVSSPTNGTAGPTVVGLTSRTKEPLPFIGSGSEVEQLFQGHGSHEIPTFAARGGERANPYPQVFNMYAEGTPIKTDGLILGGPGPINKVGGMTRSDEPPSVEDQRIQQIIFEKGLHQYTEIAFRKPKNEVERYETETVRGLILSDR